MSATQDILFATDVRGAHSLHPVVGHPSNVLNLYAGVGGNRKLWQDVNVTAVENEPKIEALFIGGTDDFKLGKHGAACVKAAKALGKWCHVGRVNTPGRLEYFEELGADSCDGTGLARYSHMRRAIY
jgi:hypothetical protein